MKLQAVAVVSVFGVAMSGCASIMTGTTQTVSVTTVPVSGADCTVKNGWGEWNVTTPGQVVVKKSIHHALVSCDKPGYQRSYAWLVAKSQPWAWGNALVPLMIGNIVDWSDGASGKYPEAVSVPLRPMPSGDASPAPVQPSKQPAVSADASPIPAQAQRQAAAGSGVPPPSNPSKPAS